MKRACPCHSGRAYAACCGPFHEHEALPKTPAELMRSRYAAFALGLGAYLVETLAAEHADLARPRDERGGDATAHRAALARALGQAKDRQRFLGLRIAHERMEGDEGEVLFLARVFERGQDRSFAELSRFVREDGAWRYLDGELLPTEKLPHDRESLDLQRFRALSEP